MTMTSADFEFLRNMVLRSSGNRIDPSRDYLFVSRLNRLLHSRGHAALEDLVADLRRQPESPLRHSVAEAMTINETSFFQIGRAHV